MREQLLTWLGKKRKKKDIDRVYNKNNSYLNLDFKAFMTNTEKKYGSHFFFKFYPLQSEVFLKDFI